MGLLHALVVVFYVFVCFFLILVVLVQQGKGADIAGAFGGGGGTQTAFGARGATTLLHKLTTGAFVAFIVLALSLTILQARPKASVVRPVSAPAKAAPAPAQKAPAPARPAPASPVK